MPIMQSDDQTNHWLTQARQGSNEALGRLFDACRDYLLRVAGADIDQRLRAKGGASDIVQETFLEAQRDFGQFTGTSEQELLAWLRHRLRYRMSKFARSHRETAKRAAAREVPLDGSSSAAIGPSLAAAQSSPSQHVLANERDDGIKRAMEQLPEDYRLVLDMRYRDGLTFEEIAQALDRTPDSVRKLWARAIQRLKGNLRAMGLP
jgi:RNA polymerase sigma-70 factor (ECF subfamily)